jgi:hypothetical protein
MTTTSRIQFLIYRLNMCLGNGTQLDGTQLDGTSSGLDGRRLGGWSSGVWRWMRGISRAVFLLATLLSFLKFQADGERHRERTQRRDFQTGSPNKYLLLFCTSPKQKSVRSVMVWSKLHAMYSHLIWFDLNFDLAPSHAAAMQRQIVLSKIHSERVFSSHLISSTNPISSPPLHLPIWQRPSPHRHLQRSPPIFRPCSSIHYKLLLLS